MMYEDNDDMYIAKLEARIDVLESAIAGMLKEKQVNLLRQAVECDDFEQAVTPIAQALGISTQNLDKRVLHPYLWENSDLTVRAFAVSVWLREESLDKMNEGSKQGEMPLEPRTSIQTRKP